MTGENVRSCKEVFLAYLKVFAKNLTTLSNAIPIIREVMITEHWRNENDRSKPKYWDINLSQCHFVHHDTKDCFNVCFHLKSPVHEVYLLT